MDVLGDLASVAIALGAFALLWFLIEGLRHV